MTVHRRLDQILQSKGQVSERQIRDALIKQSVLGGRLGEHLIRKGGVGEVDLVEALSEQYGLPGVCLKGRAIEPGLFGRIPFTVAEQYRCVPFEYDADADMLGVAFANPTDRAALRAVSSAAHPTRVKPYVAAAVHVRSALAASRRSTGPASGDPQSSDQIDRLLDLLELAVSSGQSISGHNVAGSDWVAKLAVDIADRLNVHPDERRKIRLAALISDICDWRRGPDGRPRSETLARSIVVLRDLDLPWDIVPVLQACTQSPAPSRTENLAASILQVAWAAADTMPDGDDDGVLEKWQNHLHKAYEGSLNEDVVKTAFVVLRVRSLQQRLSNHPTEIVVIGCGKFTDALLGLLQETRYRAVSAQYWAEGVVLVERRRPDLVCVVVSGLHIPPQLVMEAQMAEHGIDPTSVILIVPNEGNDFPYRTGAGESAAVVGESAGATGVLGKIQKMLQTVDTSSNPPSLSPGHGSEPAPAVVGRLADLGLSDLIQVLSSGHKTARVVLSCPQGEGSLWFDRGQVATARSKHLSGDDAFFDLLNWSDGRFEVYTVDRVPTRNITTQTTALLLEGFRRMDESKRALSL